MVLLCLFLRMWCLQDMYNVSRQLGPEPPVDLPDMLLIAFNMLPRTPLTPKAQARRPGHMREAAHASDHVISVIECHAVKYIGWQQWVEHALDAELAGNLFLAAAAHRNTAAMALLEEFKPRTVPAAACEAAMAEAVRHGDAGYEWMVQLIELNVAKACSTALVASLLQDALKHGYTATAEELLRLPGFQKSLEPMHVASLLVAALQGPAKVIWCINTLLQLPSAQDMQWGSFEAV